jgi:hypothetical protein
MHRNPGHTPILRARQGPSPPDGPPPWLHGEAEPMAEPSSETPKRHCEHSDGTPPKRTKVATDPAAEPQAPIPTGSGEVKSQESEHDPPEPLTEMEEWWPLPVVEELLKRMPEGHHDCWTLRDVVRNARADGYVTRKYKHGKQLPFGRLYSQHSTQTLTREIRNVCANGQLSDIDIGNCYPTVLLQVLNRSGITQTPGLRRYVEGMDPT